MNPRVTVGVCVRNCEASIEEAYKSIVDQDFSRELIEVVFVDDGSNDNTLSIFHELVSNSSIPTRIHHVGWRGIGNARNIVVANARGQYIIWVDGDMVISRNYVRKLVELMDSNPDLGIAKGTQSTARMGNRLAILETYARVANRMVNYVSKPDPSKVLGTGGSIYRVDMLRRVGNFDEKLRGYGEDWDFEVRARAAGWSMCAIDVIFADYERKGVTWGSLWSRYWLRGYHTHYFLHKNKRLIKHARMNPPISLLAGLLQSRILFKKTKQKIVFLLPFEHLFKTMAWYVGFLNSHLSSYEYRFT